MKRARLTWLPEELAWITDRADWPRRDLYAAFQIHFGRSEISYETFRGACKRMRILTGRDGRYQPGQEPQNKGKPMPWHPNSAATRFRKGQVPTNAKPIGHERIDENGYLVIKVALPNPYTTARTRYIHKHRYLWEQANGPLPKGHALKCLDGNKANTDPANWILVPRAMLPRLAGRSDRNRIGYDAADPEVKPAILAIAQLEHRARELRGAKPEEQA